MTVQFHHQVSTVIFVDGIMLLDRQIAAAKTFLPIGHVGARERADIDLVREIRETIDEMKSVESFVSSCDLLVHILMM
jgi:hypothetical protein